MNFLKAFVKFVPVFVLAGLMIFGKGHLFDGQDAMVAAPIAFLVAVVVTTAEYWQLVFFDKSVYKPRHFGCLLYAYRRMVAGMVGVPVRVADDILLSAFK